MTKRTAERHRRALAVGRAFAIVAGAAVAAPSWAADDDSITMNGITLYGTVDIGVAYQTHGAPLSNTFGPGLEYLLQKSSNRSILSLAPNALSFSSIGVRGVEDLGDGFAAVFKLETQFLPTSGNLADHLKSMTVNNGVALAAQSSNADSSRAGQIFQNAYVGVSSPVWGTLTLGRQNSLVLDNVLAYDPMGGSQAFSLVGFSGTTPGGGDTEDARLDAAVVYKVKVGPFRAQALGQLNGSDGTAPGAEQIGVGVDWEGLSIDGLYSFVKDAVSSAPLASVPAGYNTATALAGTISDNTAWSAMARYRYGPLTFYGAFEHIRYANPSTPLPVGSAIIGGYILATVNNTAYTIPKILDVTWGGIKYAVTPALSVTAAYYHYDQNSYSGNGCSDISSGKCSGTLDAPAVMVDYVFNRHFDSYAGAMYSHVYNGLANGYLHNNTIDPTIGVRLRF